MFSLSSVRRTVAAVALTLVAGTFLSQPAQAAAPTRIRDKTSSIGCQVETGGTRTLFAVGRSELAGTDAHFQVSADGQFQLGGDGVSDWTDSTFRASVDIVDADGRSAGNAYLSGSYKVSSAGTRELNRFKDGNIRVVEDHTFYQLSVANIVLTVNGRQLDGVTCEGSSVDGYLFFTSPSSYVLRGQFLIPEDCATVNMRDLYLEGSIDAMTLNFGYDDTADSSAWSPELNLSSGSWTGQFNFNDGTGPAGQYAATVSAVKSGNVIHGWPEKSGTYAERWSMTPYQLTITAAGPVTGASASCTLYDVEAMQHAKQLGRVG